MRKKQTQKWKNILGRFGLFHQDSFQARHALHFLNVSQFLGVVNDNAFKFLILFLFIDLRGVSHSSEILFWVGTVYVVPFLLFSPAAGVLADRFSKQRMIIILKFTEVIIMALGIIAFAFKSEWGSYFLLFLLSMQSAIFGPPKYSIIPELVKREKISKANGLITSSTYLGIIVGTFLASALTQITNRNFPMTAAFCLLLAIGGFAASLFIVYTEPKRSKRKINPLFIYEIFRNLRYASKIPFLLVAIIGSASFLFIGAYFQLNVIPYAIESLHFSEVGGGYLFLVTAIGIAGGAYLAGRISKTRIELGLSCFFGILMSLTLLVLSVAYNSFAIVFICLILIGVFGGLYVVPFDAYIQTYSPAKKRGQIVAASNFLSFCGVLIAPMLLYLFNGIMKLKAATGFTITSIMILVMILAVITRLSSYFFNAISRYLICPLFNVTTHEAPFHEKRPYVLVVEKIEKLPITLLSAADPRIHFYVPRERKRYRDLFFKLFSSVNYLYVENLKESAMRSFIHALKYEVKHHETPCLLLPAPDFLQEKDSQNLLRELKKTSSFDLKFVSIKKVPRKKQYHRKLFKRTQFKFVFTDK